MHSEQSRRRRRRVSALCLLLTAGSLAACGGDDKPTEPNNTPLVSEFLSLVEGPEGSTVTARTGEVPAAGAGPAAIAQAASALIAGGSSQVTVSAAEAFQRVVVAVGGARDYYDVALPAPVTEANLVVTLAQELPNQVVTLRWGVGNANSVGAYAEQTVNVRQVGTGDVQVSVSWDALSDVDLHVVDPAGEELYYAHRQSASGGELDLDSNAGCAIDDPRVNQENITWPTGGAPRGTYIVRLDYWDNCTVARTNYAVTIRVAGQAPEVIHGFFEGEGDNGGEGAGIEIKRFTY